MASLTETGERINAYLKRFEADKEINKTIYYDSSRAGKRESAGRSYYYAHARRAGRFVRVCYISYQGGYPLTGAEAERYLAWLDAGGVGRHFEALRS